MPMKKSQNGAVLFTALMFLIVVTFIALASIRSGVLELRMSLNDETRVSAFQQAQSLVDWVAATPAATPVVGDEDFKRCTLSVVDNADCDLNEDFVTEAALVNAMNVVNGDTWANSEFSVAVRRTGSEDSPCPRGIGTTAVGTGCAPFRVSVVYDCTECNPQTGGGRVEINEGVLVFVSTSGGNF
jgi:Tfp pilus assembly protein PilX